MGRIKQLVIMYKDTTGREARDHDADFWEFVARGGNRLGLTDEQLDALNQEGDR